MGLFLVLEGELVLVRVLEPEPHVFGGKSPLPSQVFVRVLVLVNVLVPLMG